MAHDPRTARKAQAREEILRYAALADTCKPGSEQANRYASKIWRRALKHKMGLGLLGRRICRHCHAWLTFGTNARIRLRSSRVILTCASCGHIRRIRHH